MTKLANTDTYMPSILLVEDSPSQALRFKSCLESGGCAVYWAENGYDGLQAAHEQAFNLIILDVELPDIDGFQICKTLKGDPKVSDIPVIMLTTRDKAEDALTGLGNGAVDYIPKDSFAEMVLLETIKQMDI